MSDQNSNKDSEKRKYQRLSSVFPIQFTIVRLQGDLPGIDWLEGTTRNVSQGGLCLETTQLTESAIKYLNKQNIFLELRITMTDGSIKTVVEVAWYKKIEGDVPNLYFIGVQFHSIHDSELNRILQHAQDFVTL